jgi:hypothetical protein
LHDVPFLNTQNLCDTPRDAILFALNFVQIDPARAAPSREPSFSEKKAPICVFGWKTVADHVELFSVPKGKNSDPGVVRNSDFDPSTRKPFRGNLTFGCSIRFPGPMTLQKGGPMGLQTGSLLLAKSGQFPRQLPPFLRFRHEFGEGRITPRSLVNNFSEKVLGHRGERISSGP